MSYVLQNKTIKEECHVLSTICVSDSFPGRFAFWTVTLSRKWHHHQKVNVLVVTERGIWDYLVSAKMIIHSNQFIWLERSPVRFTFVWKLSQSKWYLHFQSSYKEKFASREINWVKYRCFLYYAILYCAYNLLFVVVYHVALTYWISILVSVYKLMLINHSDGCQKISKHCLLSAKFSHNPYKY